MSVANLIRYSIYPTVHEDEELSAIKDNCGEWVKFEEAMEASSNSLQQLKAEILRYADEGIELCFGSGCDERIATRFEKIIAKLSAV